MFDRGQRQILSQVQLMRLIWVNRPQNQSLKRQHTGMLQNKKAQLCLIDVKMALDLCEHYLARQKESS